MNNFFKALFRFGLSRQRAIQIKNNPEKAPKSIRFGVMSIIWSVTAILMSCFALLFGLKDSNQAAYIIMFIIIISFAFLGTFICITQALTHMSFQFSINKNWCSWTSMVIAIVSIVACGVIIAIGLGMAL